MRTLLRLGFVALLGLAAPAHAESRDYRPDSPAWNGLSRFLEEASAQGCRVAAADAIDWTRLGPRDVLFFVYPQSPVDAAALGEFLTNGGRALIADDFGAAAPAFEALQLRRVAARLDGVPREPGHPELPVARVALLTTLGRSTPRIVTNHPAAFETTLPATFSLSPAQAVVVEGRVGRGRFVALSDPSVLINNMLELDANAAFARAVIAELCVPGDDGDRVHFYTGPFRSQAPAPRASQAAGLARMNDLLVALNHAAEELFRGALALPAALLLCAAAVAVAWNALLRRDGARHADGHFARAGTGAPRGMTALLEAIPREATARADHGLALVALRNEVLRRLAGALGPVPPTLSPRDLLSRVERVFGTEAATEVERFLSTGPSVEALQHGRHVSRRVFAEAMAAARPLLARLPLADDAGPEGG